MGPEDGSTLDSLLGDVDLVVNVFERTYREITAPSVLAALAASHCFPFARRVLLLNNVDDVADARERAGRLLELGDVDEVHLVADHLDRALAICELDRRELEPLLHFCDAPLVAITLSGSPWLVYWDAEARLDRAVDWVTPGRARLLDDRRLLVANPSWELCTHGGAPPGVLCEALELDGDFVAGPGFSDQAFLARRADLARPIYRERCVGALIHPRTHQGMSFEARVNAHMRHNGRLRATYLGASYSIDQPPDARRRVDGPLQWARFLRNAAVLKLLGRSPWRPRCFRHSWLGAPVLPSALSPARSASLAEPTLLSSDLGSTGGSMRSLSAVSAHQAEPPRRGT